MVVLDDEEDGGEVSTHPTGGSAVRTSVATDDALPRDASDSTLSSPSSPKGVICGAAGATLVMTTPPPPSRVVGGGEEMHSPCSRRLPCHGQTPGTSAMVEGHGHSRPSTGHDARGGGGKCRQRPGASTRNGRRNGRDDVTSQSHASTGHQGSCRAKQRESERLGGSAVAARLLLLVQLQLQQQLQQPPPPNQQQQQHDGETHGQQRQVAERDGEGNSRRQPSALQHAGGRGHAAGKGQGSAGGPVAVGLVAQRPVGNVAQRPVADVARAEAPESALAAAEQQPTKTRTQRLLEDHITRLEADREEATALVAQVVYGSG